MNKKSFLILSVFIFTLFISSCKKETYGYRACKGDWVITIDGKIKEGKKGNFTLVDGENTYNAEYKIVNYSDKLCIYAMTHLYYITEDGCAEKLPGNYMLF